MWWTCCVTNDTPIQFALLRHDTLHIKNKTKIRKNTYHYFDFLALKMIFLPIENNTRKKEMFLNQCVSCRSYMNRIDTLNVCTTHHSVKNLIILDIKNWNKINSIQKTTKIFSLIMINTIEFSIINKVDKKQMNYLWLNFKNKNCRYEMRTNLLLLI